MDMEFLKSLGIEDTDPWKIQKQLGDKEVELLEKRNVVEANGAYERVQDIDAELEQIRQIQEEVRKTVAEQKEPQETKQQNKIDPAKKKEAYERLQKKKREEKKAAPVPSSSPKSVAPMPSSQSQSTVPASSGPIQSTATVSLSQPQNGKTMYYPQYYNKSSAPASAAVPTASKSPASPAAVGPSDYTTGLRYYQTADYKNAFTYLSRVAENKNPTDLNAVKERTQASYLLSMMYSKGQGTSVDLDRSNHYLKRAADFGYEQAQYEYGVSILSQNITNSEEDLKKRKEGLDYVEKAADAKLVKAMEKYVDFAAHSADTDQHIIKKAKKYIPQLKQQADSYDTKRYDDFLKELAEATKKEKKKKAQIIRYAIGLLAYLIGMIYLFKGLNLEFFSEYIPAISRYIPDIPEYLIIVWPKLISWTKGHMTIQGIFGGWLILISKYFRVRGGAYGETKCGALCTIVYLLVFAVCLLHILANVIETSTFFGNGNAIQVIVFVVAILIGKCIGKFVNKITK